MEALATTVTEWRDIPVRHLPAQTRGIERSGRVSRMLPSEAVLLPHPRLRLIWFARHAERTLLTYQDDDTLREPVAVQRQTWRPTTRPQPERKLEMGPMILCVDTSGSNAGRGRTSRPRHWYWRRCGSPMRSSAGATSTPSAARRRSWSASCRSTFPASNRCSVS